MSILIVDDEERDRTWLKNLLSNNLAQEMSITEGKDGTQAVELASKL
jgi:YesN/AraC family two-component response regulator